MSTPPTAQNVAARIAACRAFLRAASAPHLGIDHEIVCGLADSDLDWGWLADYLCGSGLARPLLGVLNDVELTRVAPQRFLEALAIRGVFDVTRERTQREAIARIEGALREMGGRGVLLKGCAFLVRTNEPAVARGTSDVDVLVDAGLAPYLRAHLLGCGFDGVAGARPDASHHVVPIDYKGVAVEIHTRIMPAFWGLPEREMLTTIVAVAGSDVMVTLGPQALVFHAAVHTSASFFSFGVKTAWDLLAVIHAEPELDWSPLAQWAAALRAPRAFWAPMRALAQSLAIPIPASLLAHAPTDRGTRRIENIAQERMLSADGLFDLDAVTKAGIVMLLLGGWRSRAGYLATTIGRRLSRPGTWKAAALRAQRADALRQPWRQFNRHKRR